jgi:hypothetical protein
VLPTVNEPLIDGWTSHWNVYDPFASATPLNVKVPVPPTGVATLVPTRCQLCAVAPSLTTRSCVPAGVPFAGPEMTPPDVIEPLSVSALPATAKVRNAASAAAVTTTRVTLPRTRDPRGRFGA